MQIIQKACDFSRFIAGGAQTVIGQFERNMNYRIGGHLDAPLLKGLEFANFAAI